MQGRGGKKVTLHFAKLKQPDGGDELVKGDSLVFLACLDLQLHRKLSPLALEFTEVEKSRDLVKTAKSHVSFHLT